MDGDAVMNENARLEIRLSTELRERAEQLAAGREQTISAWVKQVMLDAVEAGELTASAVRSRPPRARRTPQ